MKILLVYPEHPVTFWSFKHALKFINKKSNLPPLGILTVAAMLPDYWEQKLVDMNCGKLKDAEAEVFLLSKSADGEIEKIKFDAGDE